MKYLHIYAVTLAITFSVTMDASAGVLFQDDFSAPTVDTDKWTVHGSGVAIENSTARITSTSFYQNGLQSKTLFNRPSIDQQLVFEGQYLKNTDQPRSASDLFLQDSWGPGSNRITLEFAKDQDFVGDHAIFYGVQTAGGDSSYTRIGQFVPGKWIDWKIIAHSVGSDIYINGELKQSVAFGAFPMHINLDGSGSTAYWDDISVTAVPEPDTMTLLGLGVCAAHIPICRRRRRFW